MWMCVHMYCLQSYSQLPAGHYTVHLSGNNTSGTEEGDTGEFSHVSALPTALREEVDVIILVIWMRKLDGGQLKELGRACPPKELIGRGPRL